MYFNLKRFLGELLMKLGYLAEMSIEYPKRRVRFGRTWRRFLADDKANQRFREWLNQKRMN